MDTDLSKEPGETDTDQAVNFKPPVISGSTARKRLALVFAFVPIGAALGLALFYPITLPMENLSFAVISLICLMVFALTDWATGNIEGGVWAGNTYLSIVVAWLALGTTVALWIILIGVAIIASIRLTTGKNLRQHPSTFSHILHLAATRTAIAGCSLVAAALLYELLGGQLPVVSIDDNIPALVIALAAGLGVTQVMGLLLIDAKVGMKPIWANGEQARQLIEILLLLAGPTLVVILYNNGLVVFGVVMAVVVIQTMRYSRVVQSQQTLDRRVQELSTLNTVGQVVSTKVMLDEVLTSIYAEISQLIPATTFVVAVYDSNQQVLDYRLVMEYGEQIRWLSRRLDDGAGLTASVIRTRQSLMITVDDQEQLASIQVDVAHMEYQAYLGVPLLVGQKCFGVIAVLDKDRKDAFNKAHLEILQSVASQTGLAIRNASLYDRTIHMARNLALVNQSVQNVMFNLDSNDAMRAACQTALEITKTDKAAVFLLEIDKGNTIRMAQALGLPDGYEEPARMSPSDMRRYESQSYIIENTHDNPDLQAQAIKGLFHTRARIPLRSGNTFVGYLAVYHDEPHFYHHSELELLETLAYQITAALDNAELLKALELYASEQAQLVHLSRISTASLELETVISGVCEIIRQMMGVEQVNIGLLVPRKDRITLWDSSGKIQEAEILLSQLPEITAILDTPSPAPRVFYLREEQVSNQLQTIADRYEHEMLVIAPMIANNETLGVVLLGNPEKRAFSDGEWRLVEMATNQVATQIHNVQVYEATENALNRRLEQLSLIERIAQQISSALDHDELIKNVVEAALRATQADMAALALLTPDDKFWIIGQELVDGEWYEYEAMQPKDQGVIGHVAETGQLQMIAYNQDSPYYNATLPEGIYLSSLAVPLIKDNQVIGVLNVESVQQDFFTEEQAGFLNSLAGHAVISIENARLLEERGYQIQTLTTLRQLSLQLSSALDTQSVVSEVLRTAISILQGKGAAFLFHEAKTGHTKVIESVSLYNGRYVDAAISIPEHVVARAAETGEMEIIEDVDLSEDYDRYHLKESVDYKSMLAVPIKRGNQVLEILCITFAKPRRFEERELNTIEMLTIQIAAHVENASLLERVRDGNTRMRAILDATRDGVIFLDRDGNLRDANITAEQMLGVSLEEHVGENFPTMLMEHTDRETGDALTDMARILRLEPERITRRQFELRQAKGSAAHVEEIASPVTDTKGNIIGRLLVFRDITEEKELEAYRDEITHMVVHDLRGPLGSIISSLVLISEILREPNNTEVGETLMPMMEISLESANRLMGLVDSLLDIAKLERREMPLERTAVDVGPLATAAQKELANSIREANIMVSVDIPADLPQAYADPDKIKRILINLLDNGLRYTPSDGEILITANQMDAKRIVVRIADSGSGIPPEERERIFEKYRQIKGKSPAHGRKGTGLGLAFCKAAIEAHGEQIWVEPKSPLSGACFAFTLPILSEITPESIEPASTVSNVS